MIIKYRDKKQIGAGAFNKLKTKFKGGIKSARTYLGEKTAKVRAKVGTDWRTSKGFKGKSKMVLKLAGATLMSPIAAGIAGVTSIYQGATSTLPGALKWIYHRPKKLWQERKLEKTKERKAFYDSLPTNSKQRLNYLKTTVKQPTGRVSSILGFFKPKSREAKLLQREQKRDKTLTSLTEQGSKAKARTNEIATKIAGLKGQIYKSTDSTPLLSANDQSSDKQPKVDKKVLKNLKSLEKQKAKHEKEVAFTESEKARKQEKYKAKNTRKKEKLQNQLERRQTRLNLTKDMLKQNVKQMKSVYTTPLALGSALIKSAYSPSNTKKIFQKSKGIKTLYEAPVAVFRALKKLDEGRGNNIKNEMNTIRKSGGIIGTGYSALSFTKKLLKGFGEKAYKYSGTRYAMKKGEEGILGIERVLTPNRNIKTFADYDLKKTLTNLDILQKELDDKNTSLNRKIEIQKKIKPLKKEAHRLSQLQSKLAHHYNLEIAKENIKVNRLNALRSRYESLRDSENGEKYKKDIEDIDKKIYKKTANIEEYNRYTVQYKYNKNPKITKDIIDSNVQWKKEITENDARRTGTNEFGSPIYSYTKPDGTIIRYSAKKDKFTGKNGEPQFKNYEYYRETIEPTIQTIKPDRMPLYRPKLKLSEEPDQEA